MSNQITRFLFKDLNIKGQIVQLDHAWQEMIAERHYPEALADLLGQISLVTLMLANGLKHPGKVTIQVQGQGPVNLLVVEASETLQLRGVAKTNRTLMNESTLEELLGGGRMLVTLDNEITGKVFQSFVPRQGNTLSDCFESYLSQSEQLPSKIWLGTQDQAIGGVMIQKMPTTDQQDEDGWDRICHLSQTITPEELTQLNTPELLSRLFVEEDIQLYEAAEIAYHCPQDRSKVENMLRTLGKKEALRILEEQGELVIHNEMCNYHERFSLNDILTLFDSKVH